MPPVFVVFAIGILLLTLVVDSRLRFDEMRSPMNQRRIRPGSPKKRNT